MNSQLLAYTVILLLAGIFSIATTSIGVQCSNSCETYKTEHPSNQTFLIVNLVSAILVTLIAFFGVYVSITSPPSA